MVIRKRTKDLGQRGQAVVELALVLPVLVMLLFGMVEGGRIFGSYLNVTHAVREGARVAALGGTDTMIVQRVMDSATMLSPDLLVVQINPPGQRQRGAEVTVSATYQVTIYAPVLSSWAGGTFHVSASTTMRVE